MSRNINPLLVLGLSFAAAVSLSGCGSTSKVEDPTHDGSDSTTHGETGGDSTAAASGGAGSNTGEGSSGSNDSGGAAVSGTGGTPAQCMDGADTCDEDSPPALDLFVMFDASGSMLTVVNAETTSTRLDIVQAAMLSFLQEDATAQMRIGLGYFGHEPLKETSCDPSVYAAPAINIDEVSSNFELLRASLEAVEPTGETPTDSALEGACIYASSYQNQHPERQVAILLVTDGEPQTKLSECDPAPTVERAAHAAASCLSGSSAIATYVLGVGPLLDNLQTIAEAGGTDAYLVEDDPEGLLHALRAIRD